MVAPARGQVVLLRFPFSDLSRTKLRPAVVLADAGRGDLVLCQVTSKPYADARAVVLTQTAFAAGTLHVMSYARPGKLFTGNTDLIRTSVGTLTATALTEIIDAVIALLREKADAHSTAE